MATVQLRAASIIAPELPIQPDVVKVHLTGAAGSRAALGAEANGDRIDIGKVHAERRKVDDPLVPSGYLRRGGIVVIDRRIAKSDIHPVGCISRTAAEPQ